MRARRTLIALIVLIAIGMYYFLIEKPSQKIEKEKTETLFSFDSANVERIKIERAKKGKISFIKKKENWFIEYPVDVDADDSIVDSIATRIEKLKVDKVISKSGKSLEVYGLASPSYIVRIYMKGITTPIVLRLGKRAPVGFKVYAMKGGDERVVLVSAGVETNLNKGITDYREKKLADFFVSDVKAMSIFKKGKEVFAFSKEDDEWLIINPIKVRANGSLIRRTLTGLRDLRVKEFVDDNPKSLKKYGLDKPLYTVKVALEESNKEITFHFGKRMKGKSEVFARTEKMKNVVTVNSDIIPKIDKSIFTWRIKKIFDFSTWKVEKIRIRDRYGLTVAIKDKEDHKWYDVKHKEEKDRDAVNEVLRALRDIEVVDYISDNPKSLKIYELDNPLTTVAILLEGEVNEREIHFGEETAHGIYAMVVGDPTVYLINKKFKEKFELNRFKMLSEEEAGNFSSSMTKSPPASKSNKKK